MPSAGICTPPRPPGQERRFSADLVGEVVRNFTLTLWNTYSFFVTYANLDGWKPDPSAKPEYSPLDRWLLSALHTLVRDVTAALWKPTMCRAPPGRSRPLSTSFPTGTCAARAAASGRANRTRDKQAAYATLYEALVTLSKLLAPSHAFPGGGAVPEPGAHGG